MRALNTKTGEKFNEVDLKRVATLETEETGFITCQANHKCKEQGNFRAKLCSYYYFFDRHGRF